jgi:hypothetical protein
MRADSVRSARPLLSRIGWFVSIWAASVIGIGVVGYAIKMVLR